MLTEAHAATPPASRALLIPRLGWVALCAILGGLFALSLWFLHGELQTPCGGVPCQEDMFYLTAAQIAQLRAAGYAPSWYATYQVVLYIIFFLVHAGLATVMYWRRPADAMARFTAVMLLCWSATFPGTPNSLWAAQPVLANLVTIGAWLGGMLFFLFLLIFPNGSFPYRWMYISFFFLAAYGLEVGARTMFVLWLTPEATALLTEIHIPLFGILMVLTLAIQIARYRQTSNLTEQQQARWVLFGIVGGIGWNFLLLVGTWLLGSNWLTTLPGKMAGNALIYAGFLLIPISIGVAILRYRLWDIDLLINRALVYGTLTACVIALYVVVVGYLGTLFRTENSLSISLLATGLVAVIFQPLRERLQRSVNRLLYGERDNPYAVMTRLGQRLEATLAPDAVLPTLAETVVSALKLPYAAILLKQADVWRMAVEHGTPHDDLQRFPLQYQGETIGQLLLAPRTPGETFNPADRRLLAVFLQQAGVAAHAVRLTRDLQQTTEDLQAARERLISAREEERRRIRRDLHDGVGPVLSSMVQRLDVARSLVTRDPASAVEMLADLKGEVRTTLADIRRLVYALRPPALDEFGLVATIREHAAHYQQPGGLQVSVDAPADLPPLPAAVEVAAYRIALEALTNAARHSCATCCQVQLSLVGTEGHRTLCIEVHDDGVGLPDEMRAGVGLASIRERATELGGTWIIERSATGGTRLAAWLPLPTE